jgi:hypothetical protein
MNIIPIIETMNQEGILFSFSGIISQSLTSFMVETAKEQLESKISDSKLLRTIFVIAIEQLQNIMSYSKDKQQESHNKYSSPGIMVVGFDTKKEKYFISSANEIFENDQEILSTKIDFLNTLEKPALRKHLREKLRSADDMHDRGAGVGFIEMAKLSSEKIEYSFHKYHDKLHFSITTYI